MPWENWCADSLKSGATRGRALGLSLALLLPGAAEAWQTSAPPSTLPHVREVHDMTGLPVTVKHVRCRAGGQPDTVADISLIRREGQYRIGRLEYNEPARAVLDQGRTFPVTRRAYDRYVLGGEGFGEGGMNALLGLWRVLGMRFRLNGAEYRCQVF